LYLSFLYFYFISIVYYVISQLSACTSDTCILKDQSINQSISYFAFYVFYCFYSVICGFNFMAVVSAT